MSEQNTKEVNRLIANTLFACVFFVFALLGLHYAGQLHLGGWLKWFIVCAGTFVTVSPYVLLKLNVNNRFLKYYMLMMMSILIGVLGTTNAIGIFLTFLLVPIVSCLYFEKKLTYFATIFSYLVMVGSVYINSAGKLEVTYLGWSHLETFFLYIAGFTIEYIVVILFLFNIVKRSKKYMDSQREALLSVQEEELKHRILVDSSKDVIFEYSVLTDVYHANRSLFAKTDEENVKIDIENFRDYVVFEEKGLHHLSRAMFELIDKCIEEGSYYSEADFSYESNNKKKNLWYAFEGFVLKDDEGQAKTVVGKMHNITNFKIMQSNLNKYYISDMYEDESKGRKSIIDYLLEQNEDFDQASMEVIATGQRLLTPLFDKLKYAQDTESAMQDVLMRIGGYYDIDKITIISIIENEMNVLLCWMAKDYKPDGNYGDISQIDHDRILACFDEKGHVEINDENREIPTAANQIWIPTLSEGEYNGAVIFERDDPTHYTINEKFLLANIANMLSAYINKANAEKANRAKSNFLSTMSHEIRTPMNAIIGMAEAALRDNMSEETRKRLNIIKSSASGLLAIINDILDFSKIESGKIEIVPEKYDVMSLLNDVLTIVEVRNKEKNLEIEFNISEQLPSVLKGDVVRIKQVMVNFANNAIKYTDEGKVTINVGFSKLRDSYIMLEFSITDTGVGIKEEDIRKLFKSYSQVDKEKNHHKEGTGLGLAISKQLIELMEGKVGVKSEYGKGSTFTFEVPQYVIDESPAGKLNNYTYTSEEKGSEMFVAPDAKVLLVDDNEINLEVASVLLAPINMQIEKAGDGTEAVALVKKNKYDIILMDHFMPVMDGAEATRIIRGMEGNPNQHIPIIALTADAISGVREKLIEEGMDDFMTKPIDINIAYKKLKHWLPDEKIVIMSK